jgi:Asp-tRNA(Asn)/Glu-tRNA(Gln) amidotransferase A subunit family amidase
MTPAGRKTGRSQRAEEQDMEKSDVWRESVGDGAAGGLDRRTFVAWFSATGLGGTLFPGVLWARAQQAGVVSKEVVAEAEKVAGLDFSDAEREMMVQGLNADVAAYDRLRTVDIPNSVPPAFVFRPGSAGEGPPVASRPMRASPEPTVSRPAKLEEVAFWPVTHLAALLRTRQVTSVELTEMYLARLRKYGPQLEAVITLTEDRALSLARRADEEIGAGRYRGWLHGIPWGAKDLVAVKGYPTTWGARPYAGQVLDVDATVVEKLDAAGAVLVAKLTLGALAQGDVWFGGRTRNPWKIDQGSSGSSAGSAASTVAGLVGFALGTETLGSIVSPSTRCGATGHRPTFGHVSRTGAMALSWTMDKIGVLGRSAEDCALVLDAIHGADGVDPTARSVAFNWDAARDLAQMRVGYFESAFRADHRGKALDEASLDVLRGLGVDLVPVELPDGYPLSALRIILDAEAAAAFDELTRSGRDDLLVQQTPGSWPNTFRTARLIPAVEYIQANRVRTLVMRAMDAAMADVDVFVTPSFGGGRNDSVLLTTNLTGHPATIVPNGFTEEEGTPSSISFIGRLWGDADTLRVAKAYQDVTDFNKTVPPLFAV